MALQLISRCVKQVKDGAIAGFLGQLGSAAYELTAEQVSAIKDVGKEVEKLSSELTAIQAVLKDAEKRQFTEDAVRDWLDKLKDVSHDIDDVLDEWSTAIKKAKMEKEEKEGDHNAPPAKKARSSLSSASSSVFNFLLHELVSRRKIGSKIKALNERLYNIAVEKDRYMFTVTRDTEQPKRSSTTSFVDLSTIHGRDREMEVLTSKLCENSQDGRRFDVIPIIGMGGIGKTTLAQLAYKHDRVKAHFEKRIWVCVSDPFDEIRIARSLIEKLDGKGAELGELDSLLQRIRELIGGKRFLLVLDDVWTDDANKWESLKDALKSGDPESRILVTTRKEEVAVMMRAERNMIRIEVLSQEFCRLIFEQIAFFDRDRCRQLQEIGEKIVIKCKGLPLVAKTLGSLMRSKTHIQQWMDVLNSELWELEKDIDKNNIFAPFLLSYDDLSSVEKRCLLYCANFPKDYEMCKDNLIELWMSQGYFYGSKNLEREGQDCFENLAMRSFFQDFEKDKIGNIKRCKMHDIMHDFVQFLTQKEFCVIDIKEKTEYAGKNPRHATLLPDLLKQANVPSSLYENKGLRTLFVASSSYSCWPAERSSLKRLFLSVTSLRTLNLSWGRFKQLPEGIEKLIHLRYLDLSCTRLKKLPNSLCDLFNLQVLRLIRCSNLVQLPKEIGKLVNLRHLHVAGCFDLKHLPKGVGKLSCLRTLDMFVVPDYNSHEGFQLQDLNMLKELRGSLNICWCGNLRNGSQAKGAQLKDKEYLAELQLYFTSSGKNRGAHDDEILEALEPHPNLEDLKINFYASKTFSPRWMTALINLKSLNLWACWECHVLPTLGKLPSLEFLHIYDFKRVERVGDEFLGIENDDNAGAPTSHQIILFPKLKQLQFHCLDMWEKWELRTNSGEEDKCLSIMPSLQSLVIRSCSKLKALPDFLRKTPLQEVCIDNCPILRERCREGVGEEWPKISHIPNIQFLN